MFTGPCQQLWQLEKLRCMGRRGEDVLLRDGKQWSMMRLMQDHMFTFPPTSYNLFHEGHVQAVWFQYGVPQWADIFFNSWCLSWCNLDSFCSTVILLWAFLSLNVLSWQCGDICNQTQPEPLLLTLFVLSHIWGLCILPQPHTRQQKCTNLLFWKRNAMLSTQS